MVSYNCQGHGGGRLEYIQEQMKDNDIILIQEHWLQQIETAFFDSSLKGLQSYAYLGWTLVHL